MGTNVFGTPITTAALRQMEEYSTKTTITNEDRALVAMQQKNEDGKDVRAREFAEKSRKALNLDGTNCLIYNATGMSIRLSAVKEWNGGTHVAFPILIQNGQWGVFLDYKFNLLLSFAAVAYDGFSAEGDGGTSYQYVLSWRNKNNELGQVFNEIRPAGYYSPKTDEQTWTALENSVNGDPTIYHEARANGCVAYSTTNSTGNTRNVEAIVSIEGVL